MRPKQMSVCFSGYRPEKLPWGENEADPRCEDLKKRLYEAVCSACEDGYAHFICGMARGADLYACEAALAARERYPHITVESAIPCPTQADGWTEGERTRWQSLVARCDFETVVQARYAPGCMQRRNRYMVEHSGRIIAVFDGQDGGTKRTVEYAMRQGLEVVLLPPAEG